MIEKNAILRVLSRPSTRMNRMYSGVRKGSHRAYSSCPLSYIVQIMKATSADERDEADDGVDPVPGDGLGARGVEEDGCAHRATLTFRSTR